MRWTAPADGSQPSPNGEKPPLGVFWCFPPLLYYFFVSREQDLASAIVLTFIIIVLRAHLCSSVLSGRTSCSSWKPSAAPDRMYALVSWPSSFSCSPYAGTGL